DRIPLPQRMSRLLHLWSGPRNVSTALMYAFARRDDTWVVDEPLYAHYLHVSGAVHPGREEVLAAQQNDGEQAARELLATAGAPLVFAKQMAHHLVGFDPGFLQEFLAAGEHLLLIRDPR